VAHFGILESCALYQSHGRAFLYFQMHMSTLSQERMNISDLKQWLKTESGADILDRVIREYSCKRSTRCWPVPLFMEVAVCSALEYRGSNLGRKVAIEEEEVVF